MRTVLLADRLVDGTDAPAIDDPVVVVDDGTIREVRQGSAAEDLRDEGTTVLDHRGTTLMPGLIDAHVHLNLPGNGGIFEVLDNSDAYVAVATANAARTALHAGITTVRDVGSRGTTAIDVREALRNGIGDGPRMLVAGPPMTITGGHCWYFGGEADGVDGVRGQVRHLNKIGADWIKVIGSGGGTPRTQSHRASYSAGEVAAIADEAHRHGIKVTMHCLCGEAMENAVAGGVDGIEHGWFLVGEGQDQVFSEALADRIAEAGITITTTLAVGYEIIAAMEGRTRLTAQEQAYLDGWRRTRDFTLTQFGRLRSHGVKFIGGTDAGWRYTRFDSLPAEAYLMAEGGMTAEQAIGACTGGSADLLGIGDQTGRVKPGLAADLIAVGGDPRGDLRGLSDVRMVMKDGDVRLERPGTGA
ncbi:MAG TPA: amidohydrolase family protein [Streptosporangiaceae bacterium]